MPAFSRAPQTPLRPEAQSAGTQRSLAQVRSAATFSDIVTDRGTVPSMALRSVFVSSALLRAAVARPRAGRPLAPLGDAAVDGLKQPNDGEDVRGRRVRADEELVAGAGAGGGLGHGRHLRRARDGERLRLGEVAVVQAHDLGRRGVQARVRVGIVRGERDRALEPRSLYTRYQPLNKRCCGNPSLQQKMKRGIITQ